MNINEVRWNFTRAVETGDSVKARRLWNLFPNLFDGTTLTLNRYLGKASERDDVSMFETLVDLGADFNAPDGFGEPEGAIDVASTYCAINVLRWLLDHGVKLNYEYEGVTRCLSLVTPIQEGRLDIVELLVEHGADFNAVWMGENALSHAVNYGQHEIADYLRSKGAVLPPESSDVIEAELAAVDDETALLDHIANQFGKPEPLSIQAIVETDPDIKIHIINADFGYVLVTTGMSAKPMTVPPGMEQYRYAELVMFLPLYWPIDEKALKEAQYYWPIEWIRYIALYPHLNQSWLHDDAAVFANDDPPRPLGPNTKMSCIMALPGIDGGEAALPSGKRVIFYSLYPLYAEERDFQKRFGTRPLLEMFGKNNVSRVLIEDRPNMIKN